MEHQGRQQKTKPFLETWLRRMRKQLAGSGKISELAWILEQDQNQLTQDEWRVKLKAILQGDEEPTLEFLTKIDSLLAKPASQTHPPEPSDLDKALLF